MKKKQANINILVDLDENKIPEKLIWSAPDGGVKNKISKAIFLSIWDHNNKESLSIDLWTKEMPVDEMNEFFYQSLLRMGETFYRATENKKIKDQLEKFFKSIENDLDLKKKYKK
tara:strand:+ start:283 stop:627 length:345 start_codon:yes stop_codon:yes gene_type:complete